MQANNVARPAVVSGANLMGDVFVYACVLRMVGEIKFGFFTTVSRQEILLMRNSSRLIVDAVRSEDDEEKAVYVIGDLTPMAPCSDVFALFYDIQYALL